MSANFEGQYKILCHILKELDNYSTSKWSELFEENSEDYKTTIENHQHISNVIPPLNSKMIEEIANEYVGRYHMELKKPFYLPPLEEEDSQFIPILNVIFDVRNEPIKICYRVGLIETYLEDNIRKARGFGFRYEYSHGEGRHGFHHSQITISPFEKPLPNCPFWIPQHIPCFPMPAKCAISLFLCMLISLYGKKESGKIISSMDINNRYIDAVKHIIN